MMHNGDMLFNKPQKDRDYENDVKISINELSAGEEQKPSYNFERIQMAIKSLNVGTWTLDLSTNSLLVCKRCKQIVEVCNEENVNVGRLSDFIPNGYGKKMMETVLLAMKTASPFDVEVPLVVTKNSCAKWLRITGVAVLNDKNSVQKLHGTVEDITQKKNGELLKQDFLAMASHDLKSPLSVIKLYLQMCNQMAENIGNNYILEMLKKAELQVNKMNRMIHCYLESSAINAEKTDSFPVAFDIKELLQEVIGDLYLLNPRQIIFLKPGQCIKVHADRDKIAQVIQNLLNNAIKYSSLTDVITVQFGTLGNFLQVVVEDRGIGIKAAEQDKIFDRFYRVESENKKSVTGYGIGLYLSKEIIKQHNGEIWIESEIDKGSKFYFSLPLS